MESFLDRLKTGHPLVADGAMGTMLMARGLKSGECPELWNIENGDALAEIARAYQQAGAEIVQTNTFGGSPLKLAPYGLMARAKEINTAAARIARRAVGDKAYISGSVGPSGKILKPYGDADPQDVYESFLLQITALIDGGVDLICIETMIDIEEAKLALKAAGSGSRKVPIMASMTFEETPQGFFTIMGTSIDEAAKGLITEGADVVGSNCGNGIENMISIAGEFKKATDVPILIQSNAGLPTVEGTDVVYKETPQFMADKAKELLKIGVDVIGGCCGTTPDHIRAIRKVVDDYIAD